MLELSTRDGTVLTFEHSLLSLSKWEVKTQKAFLGSAQKTHDEMLDYYRMMLTSAEHDPDLVFGLSPVQFDDLTRYINSTPSATPFPTRDPDAPRHTGEVLTSDLLYAQMTVLRIPWQPAETWHLNRLVLQIALVADIQKPPAKEKKSGLMQKWSDINERNKEYFKSKG